MNFDEIKNHYPIQETEAGCWEWLAGKSGGYGMLRVQGKKTMAHRHIYEQLVGPIPAGLVIDHLCRQRACCNPQHLDLVSNRTNVLRGIGPTANNARKTHCKRGHEFSETNTGHDRKGRYCKACALLAKRAWRQNLTEATNHAGSVICP